MQDSPIVQDARELVAQGRIEEAQRLMAGATEDERRELVVAVIAEAEARELRKMGGN